MRDSFIRFGNIPKDERSGIYLDGELVDREKGVSVYDMYLETTSYEPFYHIILPYPISLDSIESLNHLVQKAINDPSFPVLLVSGIPIGKGTDREPVIREVEIISDIKQYLIYEVRREMFKMRKPHV